MGGIEMMRLAALSLLLSAVPAGVWAGRQAPVPTARDVYVGCYLYVHGVDVPAYADGSHEGFSGHVCALVARSVISKREGIAAPTPHFCLPRSFDVTADPARAMALAYMEEFEDAAPKLASQVDGITAYAVAMIMKWPCP